MNTQDIYELLTSLGYELQDRGAYWSTTALFRQGDNKTALQIYKDTGVWRDFVNNTPPLRFERLVEKSVGKNTPEFKKIFKDKNLSALTETQPSSPKLQMEETYPNDCLDKLLPHYRFYNDRGIESRTLKTLRCGLATQGPMYQRLVFPIYNEFQQIHGFSGRDMLDKENRPKWKHVGKKSKWIYPAYVPRKEGIFLDTIEASGDVILVESIGDMLALHQSQYYNVLVTFGLGVSPALIDILIQLNPDRIILSFNNDSEKAENRGLTASIKSYLKLLSYFDFHKLFLCLPTANDFGDMTEDNFEKWDHKLHNLSSGDHSLKIISHAERLARSKSLSQKLLKNLNLLKEIHHE